MLKYFLFRFISGLSLALSRFFQLLKISCWKKMNCLPSDSWSNSTLDKKNVDNGGDVVVRMGMVKPFILKTSQIKASFRRWENGQHSRMDCTPRMELPDWKIACEVREFRLFTFGIDPDSNRRGNIWIYPWNFKVILLWLSCHHLVSNAFVVNLLSNVNTSDYKHPYCSILFFQILIPTIVDTSNSTFWKSFSPAPQPIPSLCLFSHQ